MKRFCYPALLGCTWLVLLQFLPTCLQLVLGQEPVAVSHGKEISQLQNHAQATVPDAADVEPATQADDSEPARSDETVRQRRFLKRMGPQAFTPELQEEAKRLSANAAKMGTDPTAIIGRAETLFRYDALEGGSRTNNVVARLDVPYHGNFLFRADLPYVWSNPNQPGASNHNGMSDLFVRTGGRVDTGLGDALFPGMDFTFPTADKRLGSGKYTVGPGVATAHVLPT